MKIKYTFILITAILVLAAVIFGVIYFMTAVRDEIDITESAAEVFSAFRDKAIAGPVDSLNRREQKMADHWSEVSEVCLSTMEEIVTFYAADQINEESASAAIERFNLFPVTGGQVEAYKTEIEQIASGRDAYEQALITDDPAKAALLFSQVNERDQTRYSDAKTKIQSLIDVWDLSGIIDEYLSRYEIDASLSLLDRLSAMWLNPAEIKNLQIKVEEYRKNQENTVLWRRTIEVLSVRGLMAFPEIVYADGSAYANNYDSALITPHEFSEILEQLYDNDYILIPIECLQAYGDLAKVQVPSGKTPFILMIEDLTYPAANAGSGVADKLALDQAGKLCTVTSGEISYDNESILILNEFAHAHPDFIFQGARGCISLTGYDGILGYRKEALSDAQPVVDALRAEGWTFACNSYGYADMSSASEQTLEEDTDHWLDQIGKIVGKSEVYVWPYGSSVRSGEKHTLLYDKGFRIFCGLGVNPYLAPEQDGLGIFLDRKPLNGYSLRNRRDAYLHLFDTEEVLDPIRPEKGETEQ